jgi:hypothetical protein
MGERRQEQTSHHLLGDPNEAIAEWECNVALAYFQVSFIICSSEKFSFWAKGRGEQKG